eukprot:12872.XXX_13560_13892_1 [CDS] Oithona nana genome sequencing.
MIFRFWKLLKRSSKMLPSGFKLRRFPVNSSPNFIGISFSSNFVALNVAGNNRFSFFLISLTCCLNSVTLSLKANSFFMDRILNKSWLFFFSSILAFWTLSAYFSRFSRFL